MISFSLVPSPLQNGRIDLVLRLYRGGKIASTTVLDTVDRSLASMVLMKCRVHLRHLGVQEASGLLPAS